MEFWGGVLIAFFILVIGQMVICAGLHRYMALDKQRKQKTDEEELESNLTHHQHHDAPPAPQQPPSHYQHQQQHPLQQSTAAVAGSHGGPSSSGEHPPPYEGRGGRQEDQHHSTGRSISGGDFGTSHSTQPLNRSASSKVRPPPPMHDSFRSLSPSLGARLPQPLASNHHDDASGGGSMHRSATPPGGIASMPSFLLRPSQPPPRPRLPPGQLHDDHARSTSPANVMREYPISSPFDSFPAPNRQTSFHTPAPPHHMDEDLEMAFRPRSATVPVRRVSISDSL